MLKKLLIGTGILVVLLVAAYFFADNRNRSLSPAGSVSLTNGDLTASMTYSRPSVKDRLIFGTEEEGALLPYGKYWRLGANESTTITVNVPVYFNGKMVPAGTYKVYAIPGPENFEIRLNSEVDTWGYFEPNYVMDLVTTEVPVLANNHVEQFTISMEPWEANGISIIFEWAKTRFEIPVQAQ